MFKLKMFLMRNKITDRHIAIFSAVALVLSVWLMAAKVDIFSHSQPRVITMENGMKCVKQYNKVISCDWSKK